MTKNKSEKPKIEINEDFAFAFKTLENTKNHIFITGKAGTGKSTFLDYFRHKSKKNIAVLAPTGVAALNVKGQTIHSFFKIPPNITPDKILEHQVSKKQASLIQKLNMIVIDEASMLRADLMDSIDAALKHYHNNHLQPFGGVQMVFIGDLYQLPPVVSGKEEREVFSTQYASPYLFSSKIFDQLNIQIIELKKIYRQKDNKFINILNKVRDNTLVASDLEELNQRYIPNFVEPEDKFIITLNTTNAEADKKNSLELAKLETEIETFEGELDGKFTKKTLPTKMELELKIGAQIMMLSNDPMVRWVNGSIGKITDIEYDFLEDEHVLHITLNSGKKIKIGKHSWNIHRYFFNEKTQKIDTEVTGSFTQYPVRLAWAVTIHKSQGKTFDDVIIDIGRGTFAHGQIYVALSRCTSLEGIILKKPIQKRHIWMDKEIIRFFIKHQFNESRTAMPLELKVKRIEDSIDFGETLEIKYLNSIDKILHKKIKVKAIGQMQVQGKDFIGVEAYCTETNKPHIFRVDRILEITE